jgi:hypothetical protein
MNSTGREKRQRRQEKKRKKEGEKEREISTYCAMSQITEAGILLYSL